MSDLGALTDHAYGLVDFHLRRLAPAAPCTLEDVHAVDDPMLVEMYDLALIGAEAVESGPAVVEEAAERVALALLALNYGHAAVRS